MRTKSLSNLFCSPDTQCHSDSDKYVMNTCICGILNQFYINSGSSYSGDFITEASALNNRNTLSLCSKFAEASFPGPMKYRVQKNKRIRVRKICGERVQLGSTPPSFRASWRSQSLAELRYRLSINIHNARLEIETSIVVPGVHY